MRQPRVPVGVLPVFWTKGNETYATGGPRGGVRCGSARFHEEQIVRLLREQELSGQTVASFIRRHGISRHTFYRWRKKYGGLTESEAIRQAAGARECPVEGAARRSGARARGAERDQRKKMERVAVRRAQVRYAMTRRLSCRRACALLQVARSALGYAARRPAPRCDARDRAAARAFTVASGRVSQPGGLLHRARSGDPHRAVPPHLQRGPTPLEPSLPHPAPPTSPLAVLNLTGNDHHSTADSELPPFFGPRLCDSHWKGWARSTQR